jgi:hypothetical protein
MVRSQVESVSSYSCKAFPSRGDSAFSSWGLNIKVTIETLICSLMRPIMVTYDSHFQIGGLKQFSKPTINCVRYIEMQCETH